MLKVSFGLNNTDKELDLFKFNGDIGDAEVGSFVVVNHKGEERVGIIMGTQLDQVNVDGQVIRSATREDILNYWDLAEYNLLDGKLEVTDKVINYYRSNFQGCANLDEETIKKKLARNIILSNGFNRRRIYTNKSRQIFRYGSMKMKVKGRRVVDIEASPYSGFVVHKRKRKYLDEVLGLHNV